MNLKDKEKDFIKRTTANLKFIQKCVKEEDGQELYEVTQLVNSLVGLLIVPQQKFFRNINDNYIQQDTLYKLKSCIEENTYKEKDGTDEIENLSTILRHMRNALAHNRFDYLNSYKDPTPFSEVRFLSFSDKGKKFLNDGQQVECTYKIIIDLDLLETFLSEFTTNFS